MRYSYRVGNSDVAIELYEYDLNALDDIARDYIAQVERTAKLTILDREVTGAVMSGSGKYLMVLHRRLHRRGERQTYKRT